MVVSPALAELLTSGEGALLRGRWGERVVGTIGAAGLSGPGEYAFYLGTDRLTEASGDVHRIRSFGTTHRGDEGIPAVLLLLAVVGLVVLLLPVAVFLASAVRFGGEARDRQLAALRLVGADAAMTRRIAAGETLAGALLGLVAGWLLFLAAGLLASRSGLAGMTFSFADLRPVPALAALVAVLVPVGAVLVTVSALRRVVLEPLGVVRRSGDRRRRLWWRLILPVAGLALLYPLHAGLSAQADGFEYQVMAGVAALLIGVALLLPWLVGAAVRRLGGGGVAWQLAVRRLQLDSGTAVRAVSGIAVSVAGAIALQGLLAAVQVGRSVQCRHLCRTGPLRPRRP
jgi:predicted lysophospholipase L1 biosynthesis ABC-type transport system permease subunit